MSSRRKAVATPPAGWRFLAAGRRRSPAARRSRLRQHHKATGISLGQNGIGQRKERQRWHGPFGCSSASLWQNGSGSAKDRRRLSERTCEGAHKERRHAGGRGGGLPVLSEHAADAEGEGRQAAVCLGQKAAFFRSDRKERRAFLLQTVPFEVWTVGFERSARRFCGH